VKVDRSESVAVYEQVAAEIRRAILDGEGLLEFRRGRGVSVAGTPERAALLATARELVDLARRHGYRRDELSRLIENLP
jgi:GntR family transcriptional regulator